MNVLKRLSLVSMIAGLTVITACGGNSASDNDTAGGGASAAPAAEAAPTQGKPVTIEFWYGLGGKLGENMESLIQKFNASQQEVIVKGIVQADYSETEQKLQAAIATGQVPAAVLSSNMDWARKGYFASMDELIAAQPDFNKEDFVQTFLKQGQVDGKQYFLPMYGTTQVMYYRKDAFEKSGIDASQLKTWEDLAAAAKKMAVQDGGKTTFFGWEPMWGSGNMIDAVMSKGGSILSGDGTKVTIDSPEWVETWDLFRKWIHEDKIMRIHSGGQGWEYWYKTIDDVMKGQAAGYTGSSGDQGDLDFSIVSAMEQPGWAGVGEGKPVAEALMAGIPAKAGDAEKQAAMKWLTYFTNSENTAFWSINTGYISVRQSALKDPAFVSFSETNPQIKVPLMQASHASAPFQDPTGGKISDALKIAADKVQIENTPAAEALKEAQQTAQAALDKMK
ncbi:ABC transporter substrate-binding protein [Paenibacillus riograndensis]|uniref:Glycerol-3-phosphate ABC transporter substrate-binding protein n=2 Tax=Paenibacillus riograndensis TaxID=483937 RepID=A0A0E4CZ41_9BACL|nr:ABC transporter substrate-binding protein [Paenibacillus riograndensis]CQR58180.1 glycerol-3-phosphate ABC transporter substrate-binding protein [Paenibacillus riograndensis SBR5]